MIYPHNFEQKTGFDKIRTLLSQNCLSSLGREAVTAMAFSYDAEQITQWMEQIKEFRQIIREAEDFPLSYFFDVREQIARLRLEGTHLDEEELFNLKRSLETIHSIIRFLCREDDGTNYKYPALQRLTDGICIFPNITRRIDQILDQYGRMKDSASPELARVRQELAKMEGSISRTLSGILRRAQQDGVVERDVTPTLRDGRLVIPVVPAMKRRINGIVHDESASGRTVFIEPQEVVEANNRIRELEADEKREVIKVLKDVAALIRPYVREIGESYTLLAGIDFIRAKAVFAEKLECFEPAITDAPSMDLLRARHPILQLSLEKHASEIVPESGVEAKKIVPLDISLTQENRMIIISGPNAGGKSVCLKTAGLLQYMLQCGVSIPVSDRSSAGIFQNIMIDIGDEQSISDDLSTYSSHLLNMKQMMRGANAATLILIDEFGTGTEPQIGGAIAESVLDRLCKNGAWGIITTHYRNLKEFADKHEGAINGAMLYDRHEMRPLFQLAIGRPGSSFAIEIARKIGLPEDVIQQATDIVGQDYIQSDKYLQDIVRDKRYWEGKRQNIHQREKDMEKTISRYEDELEQINQERKQILKRAKAEAQELLDESRRRIELAIKEIRESQAAKEETKRIREELKVFEQEVDDIDTRERDEMIERKIQQIKQRQQRREERKRNKDNRKVEEARAAESLRKAALAPSHNADKRPLAVGDTVRIIGTTSVGKIESITGKNAMVVFGGVRTKIKTDRLEHYTEKPKSTEGQSIAQQLMSQQAQVSRITRTTIDTHQNSFRQELDVRGMRGDEALNAVQSYIDDAILFGVQRVRILHGKGNGILRQLIQQYLRTIPNVTACHDEDIRFGGSGITVAEF